MPNKTLPFSSKYLDSSLNQSENRKNPIAKNMAFHRNPPLTYDGKLYFMECHSVSCHLNHLHYQIHIHKIGLFK